ncbi:MAG: pyridoxamine 5'-phosphate oxidase family protein [Anaerolineaceae bacterium]|nr:pyridoxamine 5'-phosphate oxidase family protein [Anaerolineaceae bacterium]
MDLDTALLKFWREFGDHRLMVLSTSLQDVVTSRMISAAAIDRKLFFQTDTGSRKYAQLKENPHAALCIDNIQIEGICRETGHPAEDPAFCELYKKSFPGSYDRYTNLQSERLFCLEPAFIERWVYIDGKPYVEKFDLLAGEYSLTEYCAE